MRLVCLVCKKVPKAKKAIDFCFFSLPRLSVLKSKTKNLGGNKEHASTSYHDDDASSSLSSSSRSSSSRRRRTTPAVDVGFGRDGVHGVPVIGR